MLAELKIRIENIELEMLAETKTRIENVDIRDAC